MAFKKKLKGSMSTLTINIGGFDKTTRKDNPTQIEGFYLGAREIFSRAFNKTDLIHTFQTATGEVGVWGKTDLNKQLKTTVPGTMVLVKYLGLERLKSGNSMHSYEVYEDSDNCIEVVTTPQESYDAQEIEEEVEEEAVYVAPKAPAKPTPSPSAVRQSSTLDLLSKARNKSA
jgi:hypothetical protein